MSPDDLLTDSPTDDWARDLLHEAAATIDVRPAGPLFPVPRRPRWPLLVAAAAVAGIVIATSLLGRAGPAPEPVSPSVVGDRAAVVPSVFGLTVDQARDRLEASGLAVTERPRVVCEVDRQALGTVPVTGAPVPDGSVILSWADSSSIDCPGLQDRAIAWDFLGFLAGSRPAPRFAASVELRVDGEVDADGYPVVRTLTRARAADPTSWGSSDALGEIGTSMASDDATMEVLPKDSHCGVVSGPESGPDLMLIGLRHYLDQTTGACPPLVGLFRAGGAITAISLMPGGGVSTGPGMGRLPLATPSN